MAGRGNGLQLGLVSRRAGMIEGQAISRRDGKMTKALGELREALPVQFRGFYGGARWVGHFHAFPKNICVRAGMGSLELLAMLALARQWPAHVLVAEDRE